MFIWQFDKDLLEVWLVCVLFLMHDLELRGWNSVKGAQMVTFSTDGRMSEV